MEVPDYCVHWLAVNASSNVELSTISNVCRKWRKIATDSILELARNSLSLDEGSEPPNFLLLPSMVRFVMSKGRKTNNEIETYCLAWFTPAGIRFKQLSIDPQDDSEDEEEPGSARVQTGKGFDSESPRQFAPGGEHLYAGSEDESKKKNHRRPSSRIQSLNSLNAKLQQSTGDNAFVNCLYQWDGLQSPEDVLGPFGYSSAFVENLILSAASSCDMMDESDTSMGDCQLKKHAAIFGNTSSIAVRGATVARPEGYCMCWEHDDVMMLATHEADASSSNARDKEFDLVTRRRRRRRRELQRQVLPKVLNSAPLAIAGRPQQGIDLPCIQFLNMDSSHAVRMFTPPFKPGPAPAPITVVCVGIATEDGCFMSGLKRRFELGHLYPETRRDDLIERSPVCLCTDGGRGTSDSDKEMTNEGDGGNWDKAESFNSDDSSCDMSLEAGGGDRPGFKCACPFSGLGNAEDEEGRGDELPTNVCRGSLGPGSWHCYVAVFDGVNSRIRIDGEHERVRCSFPTTSESPFLDGLTIGADHTFDMSLCFGQGSDGEGEGAIAELAVFKGKLDQQDIETMERTLMAKYGIPPPTLPESTRTDENKFYRLAHAMLSHPPGHKLFLKNKQHIPLKYMTKHRSVAWRQSNPVSGEPIRVERIGTKLGESSSDF